MSQTRIAITCPIPSDPTSRFISALPQDVDLLIADDSDGKLTFTADRDRTFLFDYGAQRRILGARLYERFKTYHKSAACRNFVHYMAYREGYDYVVALDYDCVVPEGYLHAHRRALEAKSTTVVSSSSGWVNPLGTDQWYTRGYPYAKRLASQKVSKKKSNARPVLNMGLWNNVVDINGIDKMLRDAPSNVKLDRAYTGVGGYVPLCGMNNMFLREIIPAYFFIPNFRVGDWQVSRHDDIWGGYVFQKLAKKKGDIITFGAPVVFHERESNRARVLSYEHYMHVLEPYIYDLFDAAAEHVRKGTYSEMFWQFSDEFARELSKRKARLPAHYYHGFKEIADSFDLWTTLFQKLS